MSWWTSDSVTAILKEFLPWFLLTRENYSCFLYYSFSLLSCILNQKSFSMSFLATSNQSGKGWLSNGLENKIAIDNKNLTVTNVNISYTLYPILFLSTLQKDPGTYT